ncbi:MAG: calcium-binding protein [Xenococcaceae cyanobacterium MO_167.B27]|nr:calcium-binding protein [Xenococcaceae cyanobacterium MO_167.B27]
MFQPLPNPIVTIPIGNTKWGDNGDNSLDGTPYDDTLYGRDGNDTLKGNDGSDWLYGEDGDDQISGHDGNDYLFGGDGKDVLSGDGGNDFFSGGSGNDVMGGSIGDDIMYGDSGNDQLLGGGNDDILHGSNSTAKGAYEYDKLRGDGGADVFVLGTTFGGGGAWYTGLGYATIEDFDWKEGDKIQLYGSINDYSTFTGNWLGSSATDTAITYKGDVIGVLQDVSGGDFIMSLDADFVV